jgi:ubiquinone/menaquinone biosynthesis C-methylase UbiE
MEKGKNNKIYNKYSSLYDKILLNWDPYNELKDLHLSFLKNKFFVLDAGTGTGNQAIELATNGKQVFAVDINSSMLDIFEKKVSNKNHPNLYLSKQNIENLNFDNEFFDAVTSMNVIYNLSNPVLAMKSIHNVLKNHGSFLLSGPLPNANVDLMVCNLEYSMKKKLFYNKDVRKEIEKIKKYNKELISNANFFCKKELEEILLNEIGFKKIVISRDDLYLGCNYFIVAEK